MSTYCLKGKELLLNLKRSDWLPAFDDEGVRLVATEVEEVASRMKGLLEAFDPNDLPPGVKLAFLHYRSCLSRNYRYMDRLLKLRRLRWETGAVLPDFVRHDTLSNREREYFSSYSSLLIDYNEQLGLDLTIDLEPPKELFIEIRVLQDCGKLQTESGPVSLDKGSIHFLRRSEVEQFIREGLVEQVL